MIKKCNKLLIHLFVIYLYGVLSNAEVSTWFDKKIRIGVREKQEKRVFNIKAGGFIVISNSCIDVFKNKFNYVWVYEGSMTNRFFTCYVFLCIYALHRYVVMQRQLILCGICVIVRRQFHGIKKFVNGCANESMWVRNYIQYFRVHQVS